MAGDLEALGPIGFQDLAAALATATIGAGVQVMGPGRDGGRDMYYRGTLTWSPGDIWTGLTAFQVKHKRTISDHPKENAAWLSTQIRKELDDWAAGTTGREIVPDHLLVISNVPLSPTPGSGGHDTVLNGISKYIESLRPNRYDASSADSAAKAARYQRLTQIKSWRVWDRHQLDALLRGNVSVRAAFPSFLTAADVFNHIATSSTWAAVRDVEPTLRQHARASLTGESLIYFDEAGSIEGGGLPIHKVAVDLPITAAGDIHRTTALTHILTRAEHMLKPRITSFSGPRHLVLTGAPGNGKTTLTRFLLQVFRASLIEGGETLSRDQQEAIDGVREALMRLDQPMPQNRRWAMRIDLADYAEHGGLDHEAYLMRWIADRLSRTSLNKVSPSQLHTWMTRWPSLILLDGLDEVTEPRLRQGLIAQVTQLADEAEADGMDCLIILTSRPVGYTEEIAPNHFEQIDMDYLTLDAAQEYAGLVSQVRLARDPERLHRVLDRFREALQDSNLHNLMRTPLQVLILTVIIENSGSLPPDRYSLFWSYYDTVVRRERAKSGIAGRLLLQHAQHIERLHERAGLRLQILSEAAERSFATLTREELRAEIWLVLKDAGFEPAGKDSYLVDSIFKASTERLVLIAPRDQGYGFDVRSLQELMAARRLTTGTPTQVEARIRLIAGSPHWRNALLFAAGRIFAAPQDHERDHLLGVIQTLYRGASRRLGAAFPIAPQLALEIIDDGMVRNFPKWRTPLGRLGLHLMAQPPGPNVASVMRMILRYAASGDRERKEVSDAFRREAAATWTGYRTVELLRSLVVATARSLQLPDAIKELRIGTMDKFPAGEHDELIREAWEIFDLELATADVRTAEASVLLEAASIYLHAFRASERTSSGEWAPLEALHHDEASRVLEAALVAVVAVDLEFVRDARSHVLPPVLRRPVGERLEKLL